MNDLFSFDVGKVCDSLQPLKLDDRLFLKLLSSDSEPSNFFEYGNSSAQSPQFFEYQFRSSTYDLINLCLHETKYSSDISVSEEDSTIKHAVEREDISIYIKALGGLTAELNTLMEKSNSVRTTSPEIERIILVCGLLLNSMKHYNMVLADNVMDKEVVLSRFYHFIEDYLSSYEHFICSKVDSYISLLHLYNDLKRCLVVFYLFGLHICSIFSQIFSSKDTCSASLLLIRMLPSNSTNVHFKGLCDRFYEYVMQPVYKCVYYWLAHGHVFNYPFFFIKSNNTSYFNWSDSYTLVDALILPEFYGVANQIFNVGRWRNFISCIENNAAAVLHKEKDGHHVSFDEIKTMLCSINLLAYVVEKLGFAQTVQKFGMIATAECFDMPMLCETGFCSYQFGYENLHNANVTLPGNTYDVVFDLGMSDLLHCFISDTVLSVYKRIWRMTFIPPFILHKLSKLYSANLRNSVAIATKTCFLMTNFWTFIGNYVNNILKNCFSGGELIETILKCSSLEEIHSKHKYFAESILERIRISEVFEERLASLGLLSFELCTYVFNGDEEKIKACLIKLNYILVLLSKGIGKGKELMHVRDMIICYVETMEKLEECF